MTDDAALKSSPAGLAKSAGFAAAAAVNPALLALMPAVFVALWCTGFVAARLGMPYAPPITFLAIRFGLSTLCFGLWVLISRATWPQGRAQWLHLIVLGASTHAAYLICGWAAVKHGLGAGTMALIVGLQPLLTALWLHRFADAAQANLRLGQWLGLVLGLCGLVLVVSAKLGQGEMTPFNLALGLGALLAISFGGLYQKRFIQPGDARTAMFVQLLAAFVIAAPLALLESEPVVWHRDFWIALAWSVLGLTLGGSSLLYLLLRRGAATRVSSLMYLVPPCAALLAWFLFGDPIGWAMWLGMLVSAIGVLLVIRQA